MLRKVKDRTAGRFKVQIAEVDANDLWQRAELGFSLVGNDRRVIQSLIDRIMDFVGGFADAQIIDQWSEILNY